MFLRMDGAEMRPIHPLYFANGSRRGKSHWVSVSLEGNSERGLLKGEIYLQNHDSQQYEQHANQC